MNHESHNHCNTKNSTKRMALAASLHCLAGCMIGEMIGVTIGTHAGFAPHATVILASVHFRLHRVNHTVSTRQIIARKIIKVSFRRRYIIHTVNDRRRQHNHANHSRRHGQELSSSDLLG